MPHPHIGAALSRKGRPAGLARVSGKAAGGDKRILAYREAAAAPETKRGRGGGARDRRKAEDWNSIDIWCIVITVALV
jgi:hypothetical protein